MSAYADVLVVDDEASIRLLLERELGDRGMAVETADGYEAAIGHLERKPVNIVLSDIRLAGRDGLDLTRWVRRRVPDAEVILMTGYASVQTAVEGLRLGAFDYLLKPFGDLEVVAATVRRAIERRRLERESRALRARAAQAAQLDDLRAVVHNLARRLRRVATSREAHGLLDELEEALTPTRRRITSSLPVIEAPVPGDLPRVLAIDDERFILRALRRLLRGRCELVTADGALSALDTLGRDRDFDAVLLDITMPQMNGYEVFERIGLLDADLQSRVVFCTGTSVAGHEAVVRGQAAFVAKPFTLEHVSSAIEAEVTKFGRRTASA